MDFTADSLYAALADAGRGGRPGGGDDPAGRAGRRPWPATWTSAAGSPVFVSDRITYALDGTALVADRATMLGSMMEISAERAATGLSLQYGAV